MIKMSILHKKAEIAFIITIINIRHQVSHESNDYICTLFLCIFFAVYDRIRNLFQCKLCVYSFLKQIFNYYKFIYRTVEPYTISQTTNL